MSEPTTSLEHSHEPDDIRKRLLEGHRHSYLKDFVYGAIDGTVTTFAVISGVAGAGLETTIIIILGLANIVADGFSMAVSNYLGTRSDIQLRNKYYEREVRHIELDPEGEREEVRQILKSKGFEGEALESAVSTISADKKRWIQFMLTEEFGFTPAKISPVKAGFVTFIAFAAIGFIPLFSFLYEFISQTTLNSYQISIALTAFTFFAIGAIKSRFVDLNWIKSGLETLALGSAAAGLAYGVGYWLKAIVL